jgi:hypothetical protein
MASPEAAVAQQEAAANRITAPDGSVAASEAANGAEEALPAQSNSTHFIRSLSFVIPSRTPSLLIQARRHHSSCRRLEASSSVPIALPFGYYHNMTNN